MIVDDAEIEQLKSIWKSLYSKADYEQLCYLLQIEP